MTTSRDQPGMHGKLTQVRTAYRLLHAYHRRLFDLLNLTRDAVIERFGALPWVRWGPTAFDPVPSGRSDPTNKRVFDYIPLGQAYFCWASNATPVPGGFHFQISHHVDSGLSSISSEGEPDPATLTPPEECETILCAYVKAVRGKGAVTIPTWTGANELIEKSAGFKDDQWREGSVFSVPLSRGITLQFGGFQLDAADIVSRAAAEERLVMPLLSLIEACKA